MGAVFNICFLGASHCVLAALTLGNFGSSASWRSLQGCSFLFSFLFFFYVFYFLYLLRLFWNSASPGNLGNFGIFQCRSPFGFLFDLHVAAFWELTSSRLFKELFTQGIFLSSPRSPGHFWSASIGVLDLLEVLHHCDCWEDFEAGISFCSSTRPANWDTFHRTPWRSASLQECISSWGFQSHSPCVFCSSPLGSILEAVTLQSFWSFAPWAVLELFCIFFWSISFDFFLIFFCYLFFLIFCWWWFLCVGFFCLEFYDFFFWFGLVWVFTGIYHAWRFGSASPQGLEVLHQSLTSRISSTLVFLGDN